MEENNKIKQLMQLYFGKHFPDMDVSCLGVG